MTPRDVALPGLVLLLGLLIGIFLLAPMVSPSLIANAPPLFIASLYYAGLPILALAGASFSVSWYRGRAKDDRHRDEILEVIRTPVSSVGEVVYSSNPAGEAVVQHPLSWTESNPLYPYTVAHLQNYADTLALLDSAREYSDAQRGKIVASIQTTEQLIDQKLQSFTALPVLNAPPEKQTPYYDGHLVRYAIFTNAKNLEAGAATLDLKVVKLQIGKRKTNHLLNGSEILAAGSTVNLRKLTTTMKRIASSPEVKHAIVEIQEYEQRLKSNPLLVDFEAKRSQIAFALSAGRHALPGHCERCP